MRKERTDGIIMAAGQKLAENMTNWRRSRGGGGGGTGDVTVTRHEIYKVGKLGCKAKLIPRHG